MSTYWGEPISKNDRLYLVSNGTQSIIAVFEHPDVDPLWSTWRFWNLNSEGFSGVKDACKSWFGGYFGHIEISHDTYHKLVQITENFGYVWGLEEVLPIVINLLRSRWIPNEDIPDHENQFFASLGFNEFHASKHISIQKNGHLPSLKEGVYV